MPKILIVEDDRDIQELLNNFLQEVGYETAIACDGVEAVTRFSSDAFDLILLDVLLPKMDGFAVCEVIRSRSQVPIIMLTALNGEEEQIKGLDLQVDDYITKPFSMRELMARVKANIRRRTLDSAEGPAPSQETPSTGLVLDPDGFAARKNGVLVELTQKEFDLLSFLMAAPDKVFTREELLDKVWNYDYYGDMRTVDVTVRRLREKIEDDPGKPAHILTKRGAGYYFVL